jgi:hypothetical protein
MRAGLLNRGIEPRVLHEVTDMAALPLLTSHGLGATA